MSSAEKRKTPEENDPFSLESILAEFKGSAYIDGDKRTPAGELEQKADRIVYETTGHHLSAEVSSVPEPAETSEDADFAALVAMVNRHSAARHTAEDVRQTLEDENRAPAHRAEHGVHLESTEIADDDAAFFEQFMYAHPCTPRHFVEVEDGGQASETEKRTPVIALPDLDAREDGTDCLEEVQNAPDHKSGLFERFRRMSHSAGIEPEDDDEAAYPPGAFSPDADEEPEEAPDRGGLHGLFSRIFGRAQAPEDAGADEETEDEEFEDDWQEPEEEPDLMQEARRFATGVRGLSVRTVSAFALTLLMLFLTVFQEKTGAFPFGIGTDYTLQAGILTILLLVVMALGLDVLLDGVNDLIHGMPGCETLAVCSALFSVISTLVLLLQGETGFGLPVCLVPAFSICYAMRGRRLYRTAMANSLSAAASSAVRYGIVSDTGTIEDRAVLKKIEGKKDGFYRQIVQADIGERIYGMAAPLLLLAALVFSLLTALKNGLTGFFCSLSAMLAVCASFTAYVAFPAPFDLVARKTKGAGGVVAGWGGAQEIHDADGAIMTDEDVFPIGTVSLQSYRVLDGVPEHKAIAYAASVIVASGSGLAKVFSELMRGMGLALARVEDFECYEGGVGATVRGERVLVGTAGFMNLMSVRVPGGMNTQNTLFTAVGSELTALFTINYTPANSVQSALIALIRTRASMIFAVKDFNVTPAMIRQKFKVPVSDIEYIPSKDCYRLSDGSDARRYDAAALIYREGLGPFADLIRRGRRLYTVTLLASAISVIGAYAGLLVVFALCWLGAYISASGMNIVFYMMAMHLPLMLLVRRVAGGK